MYGAGPGGGVNGVALTPDGKLLARGTTTPKRPRMQGAAVEPATNRCASHRVRADTRCHPGGGVSTRTADCLASADTDGTVRLWNPATGQPASTLLRADTGPGGGVNGVAFSPDGKLLASADNDGTMKLWDVSLFANPYAALCTDVGPPTRQDWDLYALAPASRSPRSAPKLRGMLICVMR